MRKMGSTDGWFPTDNLQYGSQKVQLYMKNLSFTEETLQSSLRPMFLLCKLFGVFPLQNVLKRDARLLRYRWFSLDTMWVILVVTTICIANDQLKLGPWPKLILKYLLGRFTIVILLCVIYDTIYLPDVITKLDDVNAKFQILFARKSLVKYDKVCAIISLICVIFQIVFGIVSCTAVKVTSGFNISFTLVYELSLNLVTLAPRQLFLCLYLFFCHILAYKFRAVRAEWQRAVAQVLERRHDVESPSEFLLEEVRLLHSDLTSAVNQLSVCYGPRLVIYFLMVFFEMLLDFYQAAYMNSVLSNSVLPIGFNVFNFGFLFVLASMTENITSTAQQLLDDLRGIPITRLSRECERQVRAFQLQLMATPAGVSAAGFCLINRALLLSMCVAMTTYLIVIMQFSPNLMKLTSNYTIDL